MGEKVELNARPWVDELALWVLEFAAFSFAGWFYETLENVFTFGGVYLRASLGLPWCPIYGVGGVIMVIAATPIIRSCRERGCSTAEEVARVAVCVGVVALVTELACSYLLEWLTGGFPWDYSQTWGNFEGRIAPPFTAGFIVLGLMAAYGVAPWVAAWADEHRSEARSLAILVVALLAFDCALEAMNAWDPLQEHLEPFGIHHWT